MVSSIGSSSAALQNIQQRQGSFFKKVDTDGSGGLSVDEFSAMVANAPSNAPKIDDAQSSFTSMDANGDGSLSQSELDTGMQSLMDASQSTVARFGGNAPPEGPPPPDGPPPSDASSSASDVAGTTTSSGADDVLSQLLSALSSISDSSSAASSSTASSASDTSTSSTAASSSTSSDSAAAMAQKLSKMFEQMATAFASFGIQNGNSAGAGSATNSVSLTA